MPGIKAVITYHLEIPVRDMLDEEGDKIHDRDGFADKGVVLMAVIVEGDGRTIIGINAFQCDSGPSEVTSDVFSDDTGIAKIRLSVNIETVIVFAVNEGFGFLERRLKALPHQVKERGLEGAAQESITEMLYIAPEGVVGETALGNKAVDMWVPL